MAEWKLVPVKLTREQDRAGVHAWHRALPCRAAFAMRDTYSAVIAASPNASEDESLVERVATMLHDKFGFLIETKDVWRKAARAILKLLEGNHD